MGLDRERKEGGILEGLCEHCGKGRQKTRRDKNRMRMGSICIGMEDERDWRKVVRQAGNKILCEE